MTGAKRAAPPNACSADDKNSLRQKGEPWTGSVRHCLNRGLRAGRRVGVSKVLGGSLRRFDKHSLEHGTYCWIVQRGCDKDTKQVLYR